MGDNDKDYDMEGVEKEVEFEYLDLVFLSDEEEDSEARKNRLNPNGLGFIDGENQDSEDE